MGCSKPKPCFGLVWKLMKCYFDTFNLVFIFNCLTVFKLLKIQQKTIIHEIIISYTANNNRRLIVNWTHPEYFIISSDIFAFNVSAWVSIQKKNPFILKNNWKTVYCKQELKSKNQIMMSKLTTTLDTHNY